MEEDKYKNKLNGFYLIGFFDKGKRGKFLIEKQKPFVTDENGISHGKCFVSYPTNSFPTNWLFIETDVNLKDIHKHKDLKEDIDDIWKDWCKEHKRRFESVWEETEPQKERVR